MEEGGNSVKNYTHPQFFFEVWKENFIKEQEEKRRAKREKKALRGSRRHKPGREATGGKRKIETRAQKAQKKALAEGHMVLTGPTRQDKIPEEEEELPPPPPPTDPGVCNKVQVDSDFEDDGDGGNSGGRSTNDDYLYY